MKYMLLGRCFLGLIRPLSRIVFGLNSDGISLVYKIMFKGGDVTQLWLDSTHFRHAPCSLRSCPTLLLLLSAFGKDFSTSASMHFA